MCQSFDARMVMIPCNLLHDPALCTSQVLLYNLTDCLLSPLLAGWQVRMHARLYGPTDGAAYM
jgi:hypothetical protein